MNTATVMRSSAVMAAGTAVSRLLGFVRASMLIAAVAPGWNTAHTVNGTPSADAFSVANPVPNAFNPAYSFNKVISTVSGLKLTTGPLQP